MYKEVIQQTITTTKAEKMKSNDTLAPGARIQVRDAEWLVRSTARTRTGSQVLNVVGVSDFIKGRQSCLITDLEPDLKVLDPKKTQLVQDESEAYQQSLLFIESHLRQTVPTNTDLYIGHQGVMDVLPFQLDPAVKALKMPRQRLLIADAVGLGKTLEAGILVSELIRRGKGRRILVVTTKGMLTQFQKEFWARFTIPLVRLDSVGFQRIRSRIPTNHNPFYYYDQTIISIDTLKQEREYRNYIENADWDIIVIDEAHNVALRNSRKGASLRAKLAERLATRSDALILLSATPHDGRPESFASLMNMLDPTAIANEKDYTKDEIRDLYVRRFKKDVAQQLAQNFPERELLPVEVPASNMEEKALHCLDELKLVNTDARRQAGKLFKTTLLKAMLSSPMACLETVKGQVKKLEKEGQSIADLEELKALQGILEQIKAKQFSKYQRLLQLITSEDEGDFAWTGKDAKDRIVIFTERLETMRFLKEHLQKDLSLKKDAIATLDGGMSDVDQMAIVESFGQEKSPLRVLIATEVASEGLNLHYLCHRLIHFDIPWSLMTLQQRNGRIDRYGQESQPQIRYLLNRSQNPRVDEVERIIKILIVKDEQAVKNIGDPSTFMGVFDAEEEVRITAEAVEAGKTATEFEQSLDASIAPEDEDEFDFFALLDQEPEVSEEEEATTVCSQMPSLFTDDYHYAIAALKAIQLEEPLQLTRDDQNQYLELTLPQELRQQLSRLPKEIIPDQDEPLQLSGKKEKVAEALEAARRAENSWPKVQYLWELHPFINWLNDRGVTIFGRHKAPVITLETLEPPDEAIFIISGVIPNRRGQPLINQWLGIVFVGGTFARSEDLETTLKRTQLGHSPLPNAMSEIAPNLSEMLPEAVEKAKEKIMAERDRFEQTLNQQLQEQLDRLEALRTKHTEQLELKFTNEQQKSKEKSKVERMFDDYLNWVEESMTTEPVPYLKVIAVLHPPLTPPLPDLGEGAGG